MDINKVMLIGRLTRKPESKATTNGQHLATFSVATNYSWRDYKSKERKDKTEFHRIIVWGKLAEIVTTYLDKGSRVYIEGRLQYRTWQDPKGQKRTMSDVIADEVIMLGHNGASRRGDAFVKEEPSEKELVVEEV
jgi:single-strand DNA-binding protein